MNPSAPFRVDPRLTAILGESYSSSERFGLRQSAFDIPCILRVGGKSIGRPHQFGLEHDEMLSDRSKRRVVGEANPKSGKPVEPRNTRTTRKEHRRKRLGDQSSLPAKVQNRPALSCISCVSWLPLS